jgi:hypothetical protein
MDFQTAGYPCIIFKLSHVSLKMFLLTVNSGLGAVACGILVEARYPTTEQTINKKIAIFISKTVPRTAPKIIEI